MASVRLPLWHLTRDPALQAFLRRGARDAGHEPAVAKPPRPRSLNGGAAVCPLLDDEPDDHEALGAMAVHLGRNGGRVDNRLRLNVRELEDA